jgi:hypothetical protein
MGERERSNRRTDSKPSAWEVRSNSRRRGADVPVSLGAGAAELRRFEIAMASAHADADGSALFVAFAGGQNAPANVLDLSKLTRARTCGK